MRLHRLELTNYRRHRHSRVEFADGVTAVIGRNGSGKSSLIEALGFALFGTGATRTSKDLLRSDDAAPSDAVSVTLEFDLDGQAVGVVRELRGRNLTPSASLTVNGQTLVPAGAGSSDAVTKQLEKLLGLNADGFFTTVVARQKELSRLADQKPTERKRLILEMLGVDELDRAIARARRRRLDAEAGARALADSLGDPAGLAEEARLANARLAEAKGALASAQVDWQAAKQADQKAAAEADRLEHMAQQYASMVQVRRDAEARHQQAMEAVGRVKTQLQEAEAAHQQAERLTSAATSVKAAQDALAAAEQRHRAANQRRQALEQVAVATQELQELEKRLDAQPVAEPVEPGRIDEANRRARLAQSRLARLEEALAVARHNLNGLDGRLAELASLGSDAPCPTCERPLADHLPDLNAKTRNARATAQAKVEELAAATTQAKAEADAARQMVADLDQEVRAAEATQVRRASLEEQVVRARRRLELAERGVPEDPGPTTDAAPLRQALAEAQAARDDWLRATERAAGRHALAQELSAAEAARAEARRHCLEAQSALDAVEDPARDLQAARRAREAARTQERQAEATVARCRTEYQVAEVAVSEVERRRAEDRERRRKLASMQEEARYWAALAGSRGGGLLDNFRVHLVSRVGPAIAAEASRLLAQFTGGRYTEIVLDDNYAITVAEGGVAYPLERFSGGEADVVHLALRLAVSRLLAQRSGGAELRFLALDEVFGSLDAERRELVAGTLEQLTHLYSQVVAVTHLEDLQELDHVICVQAEDGQSIVTTRS